MGEKIRTVIFGLLLMLVFRLDSLLYSLPAWATLILHFTHGLSIKWFWLVFGLWIAVGVFRYLLLVFARSGAQAPVPEKENKNPYSVRSEKEEKTDE
ncbi:MAG: hypothetical protein IKN53_06140 [Oscillibacter sp.]|nr:hypothetical protein [Oscillibacter sp.]